VDRDSMTDRQRQEVKGMHAAGYRHVADPGAVAAPAGRHADDPAGVDLRRHVGLAARLLPADDHHAGVPVDRSTPPPASTRYEAENATIFHGTVDADHAGFTGTGFVKRRQRGR
jgi:hypothetical protein